MKRRSLADPNLVEKYIRGQVMPRFMQRGRPWWREPAGPRWVLERFPARRR